MNGALGRLDAEGSVDELYNKERATVSLGYIGLYEVATTFYGPTWENNPEAKAFTIEIVKRMHEDCEDWSKASGYHYSVYSTPNTIVGKVPDCFKSFRILLKNRIFTVMNESTIGINRIVFFKL